VRLMNRQSGQWLWKRRRMQIGRIAAAAESKILRSS